MKNRTAGVRHGRIRRYIEADELLVVLDVPVIYAPEDPGEALLETKTIKLLDEATRRARAGDRAWLRRHGKVYLAVPA